MSIFETVWETVATTEARDCETLTMSVRLGARTIEAGMWPSKVIHLQKSTNDAKIATYT